MSYQVWEGWIFEGTNYILRRYILSQVMHQKKKQKDENGLIDSDEVYDHVIPYSMDDISSGWYSSGFPTHGFHENIPWLKMGDVADPWPFFCATGFLIQTLRIPRAYLNIYSRYTRMKKMTKHINSVCMAKHLVHAPRFWPWVFGSRWCWIVNPWYNPRVQVSSHLDKETNPRQRNTACCLLLNLRVQHSVGLHQWWTPQF
jgi:hypothetical protein